MAATVVLETAGTAEATAFARQLADLGMRVSAVPHTHAAVAALADVAGASGELCYVHTRVAEAAPRAGAADFLEELRSLAQAFPRLVDVMRRAPSPHAVFIGSDAAWGQTPDPALASYAAWTFALCRNMDLIAAGSVRANAVVGRRLDQPWATRPCADLVAWLLRQPVAGQEFDVSAPRTIGVLKW